MRCIGLPLISCLLLADPFGVAWADEAAALRLAPFPKEVKLQSGAFSLNDKLVLEAPPASAELFGRLIGDELRLASLPAPEVRNIPGDAKWLRLSTVPGNPSPKPTFRDNAASEDYVLEIRPDAVVCTALGDAGLLHGAQTLRQLIRANRRGSALPCLHICDWPSMVWRGFQDQMDAGPSAKLDTLKLYIDLGSELKMNLFTYTMAHQFAFKKHPVICPKNGAFTPEDLKSMVEYAKPRQIDILGNQQSFGHLQTILSHPEYANLRETANIISPVKEETYKLLDDLYSEVVPLLPFPWFNICCDETDGLGTGPSKELAAQIGAGGVYVRHIRRLHDLLKNKYGKRIMIWGDIILRHPDKLDQIPKDTIMLTWGYEPAASFEGQIIPFAKSGYEYFVCPGINSWLRILPDFGKATVNIQNFVRDGVKHGALGMINTEWKDDRESIRGYNWHGYAWGAECAWNASATKAEDFNRRIGGVLFGEKGHRFGAAIESLAKVTPAMSNARFWQNDFAPQRSEAAIRTEAEPLLAVVRPAIEQLEACRKEAVTNAGLLDDFLLGARRIERVGQRMLDGIEAAKLYAEAAQSSDKETKLAKLTQVERLVRQNRDAYESLGKEFARIWLSESKPYALDEVTNRYAGMVKWYDDLGAKLADARKSANAGEPLPSPKEMGLALPQDK